MKLDILVLTQPSRKEFLRRFWLRLEPQLTTSEVGFHMRMFDQAMSLGENREFMRQASKGEYICFCDDDDLLSEDYVSTILPLLDGVDYVGFQVEGWQDGVKMKPTFHSLRYKDWHEDQHGFYRDISHLNPIRRELALLEPMEGDFGEDHRWADRLRARGVVKTEHYINRVMYFYHFRSGKTD